MDIRETIIEAALKLLRKHGFGALSQPRIAAEAGVRQSHLTYYFPSRGDLLFAVADRSCEVLLAPLADRAARGDLSVEEVAEALCDAISDRGVSRIFHALISGSDEDSSLKRKMRKFQAEAVRDLQGLFGGAGLEVSTGDARVIHAMLCGASSMDLGVCSPASRRDAREALRRTIDLVRAAASPSARPGSRARPAAPPRSSRARKARGK